MLQSIDDLTSFSGEYLLEFNTFCSTYGLIGKVVADHIGLKCSSREVYERQKSLFDFESRFMYQSIISGRRISVVGLTVGLETSVGLLAYLELSDQKPDGSQRDLFDHVEVVPHTGIYDDVVQSLRDQSVKLIEVVRPHHTTYDIRLSSGFTVKLSRAKLIEKITKEEMK